MITVREVALNDVNELREVAISSYRDTFAIQNTPENMEAYFKEAYGVEALTRDFHEPDSKVFVAVEYERIVGFVLLRKSDEVKEKLGDNAIEVQRLYVLTSAQGKSAGKR